MSQTFVVNRKWKFTGHPQVIYSSSRVIWTSMSYEQFINAPYIALEIPLLLTTPFSFLWVWNYMNGGGIIPFSKSTSFEERVEVSNILKVFGLDKCPHIWFGYLDNVLEGITMDEKKYKIVLKIAGDGIKRDVDGLSYSLLGDDPKVKSIQIPRFERLLNSPGLWRHRQASSWQKCSDFCWTEKYALPTISGGHMSVITFLDGKKEKQRYFIGGGDSTDLVYVFDTVDRSSAYIVEQKKLLIKDPHDLRWEITMSSRYGGKTEKYSGKMRLFQDLGDIKADVTHTTVELVRLSERTKNDEEIPSLLEEIYSTPIPDGWLKFHVGKHILTGTPEMMRTRSIVFERLFSEETPEEVSESLFLSGSEYSTPAILFVWGWINGVSYCNNAPSKLTFKEWLEAEELLKYFQVKENPKWSILEKA